MRKFSTTFLGLSLLGLTAFAQAPTRSCASMEVLAEQMKADPGLAARMQAIERHAANYESMQSAKTGSGTSVNAVVTIPVVVHVVYNTTAQNVSATMIQNQINVLNQDFAKLNADVANTPSIYAGLAANTNIQFCLATVDPNGNPTSGIERRQTKTRSFSSNDYIKYYSRGGLDAWPSSQYLNLWVGNLGQGLLGYAQFPGGAPATDGVVVLYSSLPGGTATSYNKGRTATHEIGHWLNLRHIWGDATCGNDQVSDTPTQQTSNGGCPAFPHVTCGNQGDMSMNYMDYTYDACMYMFTTGQSTRMNAVLAPGGARASLLSSGKCGGAVIAANGSAVDAARTLEASTAVFPNPVTSEMTVRYALDKDQSEVSITIHNMLGEVVKQYNVGAKAAGVHNLNINTLSDMQNAANGMYTCTIKGSEATQVVRFMLNK